MAVGAACDPWRDGGALFCRRRRLSGVCPCFLHTSAFQSPYAQFFSKAPQWRILVVSGDADSAVPFMGTMRWMNCLARPVKKDWENWMLDGDVAGSVKQWDRMSFMTVKGCGHTINT